VDFQGQPDQRGGCKQDDKKTTKPRPRWSPGPASQRKIYDSRAHSPKGKKKKTQHEKGHADNVGGGEKSLGVALKRGEEANIKAFGQVTSESFQVGGSTEREKKKKRFNQPGQYGETSTQDPGGKKEETLVNLVY